MSGLQLLVILLGFFSGVVVESVYQLPLIFLALLGAVVFLLAVLWRRSGALWYLAASLCLFLLCAGVVRTQQFEAQFVGSPLTDQVGERITIVGQVATEPDVRANFTQLFVQTEADRILVRADRFVQIEFGDVVSVSGTLEVPEPFQTDTNRVFDYPTYLQVRGVQYVMSFVSVEVLEPAQGNPLLTFLYYAKSRFVGQLEQAISSPSVDLGVGLLLGVKQALGDDLEAAFRQTGIIHIVVLSGYNVMLVVGFFWWVSSWFLPLRGRIIFGLIGITLFALLVGLSATVVRASIMAAILLIGKLLGRLYDVLRSLLFAAAIMVLINPYLLLYDIGFQLSFMATLGLVLVLPQFESTLQTNASGLKLRDLFLATVITQLFVLPLLMYHIGEVSLVSVIVNMLVLPMVPIAMLTTFVTGLVSMVSVPLGMLLGYIAQLPLLYIIGLAEFFGGLPFAAVVIPQIPVWLLITMYVLPAAVWVGWRYFGQTVAAETPLSDWTVVEEALDKTDLAPGDARSVDLPIIFR